MVRAAFGELRGGEAALSGLDGKPLEGRPEDLEIVFLSRLDCEVRCLELPPLPERDLPSLLRYRLRSVFPGSLQHAVVDHVTQRRGTGVVALVSIVDAQALQELRRAAPRAAFSLLCAALLRTPLALRRGCIACQLPGYTEVLEFDDGVLVESVLVRQSRSPAHAQRVLQLLASRSREPPLLLAPGPGMAEAKRRLGAGEIQARALESLDLSRRSAPPLFRPPRRWKWPRPAVVRAALAAALLLLAAAAVLRQAGLRQAELSVLRNAVLGGQAAGRYSADLAAQFTEAGATVSALERARPVDVYRFLADLRGALGPGVVLQDLVLQDRSFQLQAAGPGPLELMQRLAADPRFQSVRLLQTAPTGDGPRQQFIITGRYAP